MYGAACFGPGSDIYLQVNTRMLERDIYDGEPNLDKSGLWEKSGLMKSKL